MEQFNPKEVQGVEKDLRTNSAMYNAGTKQQQLIHEEVNTAYNHHTIIKAFQEGRAFDISDVPKRPIINGEQEPCIIIGSGPSFDLNVKFLKDWKGGIICSSSHALTLMKYGIEPTHIVGLDPFSTWDEIKGVDWSKTRTKLVAHPGIWPSMIENWPNEMYLYIENIGQPASFYATTQKHMFSYKTGEDIRHPTFNFYIKTEITLFACSPPIQLFVAEVLGYGTCFLMGCDFGYHHGLERFTNYTVENYKDSYEEIERLGRGLKEGNPSETEEEDFWQRFRATMLNKDNPTWIEHKHPLNGIERGMVRTNSGLYSETIHIYYKKNMLSAWILGGGTLYSTDHGIMTEVPYHSMESVVKSQGYGYPKQTPQFISDHAEPYLASMGAFVLHAPSGTQFVEAVNPEVDLVHFMNTMNRRYVCNKCGVKLNSNSDNNTTGEPCPNCVQVIKDPQPGTLSREINIDIEANMNRVHHYLKIAEEKYHKCDEPSKEDK